MRDLDHINVMQLKSVRIDQDGLPCFIFPYMAGSDLHSYVTTHGHVRMARCPENTRSSTNVVLMLRRRLRRRISIIATLTRVFLFC